MAGAQQSTFAGPAVKAPASTASTDTVTIACKHPAGLQLRTFNMVKRNEAAPGGHREVEIAHDDGQPPIIIKGNRTHFGMSLPHVDVTSGYALTTGVNKARWERWLEDNKDSDLVKNQIVFAIETPGDRGQIDENEKRMSGLEPLDPEKPMRGIRKFKADKMDND